MSTYEISKSSLLSLKAEILRKQEDLSKAKLENEAKIKVLKRAPLEIKNKGVDERNKNDFEEDPDLLKLSKSVLESKAELYEKLSSGTLSEEERKKYQHVLVQFNVKQGNKVSDLPPSDSESDKRQSESENDEYYESDENEIKDPGEEWVEYVDCFGRSRKCMQKDLEFLKAKDKEMKQVVEEKKQSKEVIEEGEISKNCEEAEAELMSNDMRRDLQRRQWEQQEEENLNKSKIHYEDVLFGEARTHGVGYYGFSKDEEEREKQQEALRNLRKETEDKQKQAQQLRETREKLLAARLKAARNRKRARMGLPPEEDEPELVTPQPEKSEKDLQEQKEQEAKERLLEEARKKYVRPWDIGKEGVKEVEVMTQKEWVEKKREDRPQEFAPPSTYRKNFRATEIIPIEDELEVNETLKFSSKQRRPTKNTKWKQKKEQAASEMDKLDQKEAFFDKSKKSTEIYNDSTDLNWDIEHDEAGRLDNVKRKGAEVAPPATYDYYGPTSSKIKRNQRSGTDIQDSIEAGLKFLRKQVEDKQKTTHVDDMFLF